jgi:hypothetical protein
MKSFSRSETGRHNLSAGLRQKISNGKHGNCYANVQNYFKSLVLKALQILNPLARNKILSAICQGGQISAWLS